MTRDILTNLVILVVLLVWVGSIIMDWVDRSYSIPVTVQIIMGAVASFLFGQKLLSRGSEKNE